MVYHNNFASIGVFGFHVFKWSSMAGVSARLKFENLRDIAPLKKHVKKFELLKQEKLVP